MNSTANNTDFRSTTVWLYIVMFAVQAMLYRHRWPEFSWIALGCAVLFAIAAVTHRLKTAAHAAREGKG